MKFHAKVTKLSVMPRFILLMTNEALIFKRILIFTNLKFKLVNQSMNISLFIALHMLLSINENLLDILCAHCQRSQFKLQKDIVVNNVWVWYIYQFDLLRFSWIDLCHEFKITPLIFLIIYVFDWYFLILLPFDLVIHQFKMLKLWVEKNELWRILFWCTNCKRLSIDYLYFKFI